jgi:hypothetical protein
MSSNNFSWLCCNKTPEKRTILETVLPPVYKYKITSFKLLHESDVHNQARTPKEELGGGAVRRR